MCNNRNEARNYYMDSNGELWNEKLTKGCVLVLFTIQRTRLEPWLTRLRMTTFSDIWPTLTHAITRPCGRVCHAPKAPDLSPTEPSMELNGTLLQVLSTTSSHMVHIWNIFLAVSFFTYRCVRISGVRSPSSLQLRFIRIPPF